MELHEGSFLKDPSLKNLGESLLHISVASGSLNNICPLLYSIHFHGTTWGQNIEGYIKKQRQMSSLLFGGQNLLNSWPRYS